LKVTIDNVGVPFFWDTVYIGYNHNRYILALITLHYIINF